MFVSHRIQLDPNNQQRTYFAKGCGVARVAYNWALAEWERQYQAHRADKSLPRPSEGALRRQLNAIKDEQYPWMSEVTKCAPQHAIMNLGAAFENFFRDLKKPKKEQHFKAVATSWTSFRCTSVTGRALSAVLGTTATRILRSILKIWR